MQRLLCSLVDVRGEDSVVVSLGWTRQVFVGRSGWSGYLKVEGVVDRRRRAGVVTQSAGLRDDDSCGRGKGWDGVREAAMVLSGPGEDLCRTKMVDHWMSVFADAQGRKRCSGSGGGGGWWLVVVVVDRISDVGSRRGRARELSETNDKGAELLGVSVSGGRGREGDDGVRSAE